MSNGFYMPPLMGGDLEKAIAKPAELQGYRLEDGLLGEILNDVKGAGSLPLLQFALTELWEKRDRENHLLTLEQYEVMESAIGSLNRHAEKVYTYKDFSEDSPAEERTEQEQEWIKRIVLKLVRTGEDEKDTRQRQPKGKLLAIAGDNPEEREVLNQVIEELVQGRLLVTEQESQQGKAWVDLAHEALMDKWKRFAQWRQENRELRWLVERIEFLHQIWLDYPEIAESPNMNELLIEVEEQRTELEPMLDRAAQKFLEALEESAKKRWEEEYYAYMESQRDYERGK
jgi:dephospho-CoA kinase